MIHSALAFFFGIHDVTPIKGAWVALMICNVLMMFAMSFVRRWDLPAGVYWWVIMITAIIQGSQWWDEAAEVWLALFSAIWVWSMLPRDKYGRVFALAIGITIGAILAANLPRPWPMYSQPMFYTRLYSCTVFGSICYAITILDWADSYKRNINSGIAMVWFAAVIFGSVSLDMAYWTHRVIATSIWTACLLAWLTIHQSSAPADQGDGQTDASAPPRQSRRGLV